jgi:hypothetical protein
VGLRWLPAVAEQGWLLAGSGLSSLGSSRYLPLRTDFLNRDSVALFVAPDAQVRLTMATLRRGLSSLSARGLSLYAWSEVTLDGAFPLFYGLFLILGMQRLWPRPQSRAWGRWRTLTTLTLPLVVVACDWLENAYFFRLARQPSWIGQGPPRPAEGATLAALGGGLCTRMPPSFSLALCLAVVAAVLVKSGAAGAGCRTSGTAAYRRSRSPSSWDWLVRGSGDDRRPLRTCCSSTALWRQGWWSLGGVPRRAPSVNGS